MKTIYKFAFACLLTSVLLLNGCSIQEKTQFNADFSGENTTTMDFTLMTKILRDRDSTGNTMKGFMDGMKKGMSEAMGKNTNLRMSFDSTTNQLSMTYAFTNLSTLNEIHATLQENSQQGKSKKKAKSVSYAWKKANKVLIMPGVEGVESFNQFSKNGKNIDSMMVYEMTWDFPKEIETVNDNRLQISANKKTISLHTSADQLLKKPLNEIIITFRD